MTTIAVLPDSGTKGTWKVLVNYIQRGVSVNSMQFANQKATELSQSQPCDHLILATEGA